MYMMKVSLKKGKITYNIEHNAHDEGTFKIRGNNFKKGEIIHIIKVSVGTSNLPCQEPHYLRPRLFNDSVISVLL